MASLTNFNLSIARNLLRKREYVIEASTGSDGNTTVDLSSSDVGEPSSMQTLGRPAEHDAQTQTRTKLVRDKSVRGLQWVVAAVVLAAWCLFVNLLEGFDFDTLFMAVFCTIITMFVLKSFTAALSRRPRF